MPTIAPIPASHADLLDKTTVALTTIGPDGRPQTTAIWLVVDDDGIVRASITDSRQKMKNMLARSVATLFAIDPENSFRTLELRCDVVLTPDPDALMMRRVLDHYGEDFEKFRASSKGRYLVELFPRRVIAHG